jgi:hypothetical protein
MAGVIPKIYFAATGSRFWRACADYDPAIIAILLPWSTSLVVFVLILWIFAILPRLDAGFIDTLRHPMSVSALALVGIAIVGTLWGDGPWWPRLLAIGPLAKLLFLPLLLFHYQRSARAHWVLWGFIGSCAVLMVYFTPFQSAPYVRSSFQRRRHSRSKRNRPEPGVRSLWLCCSSYYGGGVTATEHGDRSGAFEPIGTFPCEHLFRGAVSDSDRLYRGNHKRRTPRH